MSNPLDLAVDALKGVEPRQEAVARAVAALHRPSTPRLVPLAFGVAALSAVALWPRGSSGLAWAQIAAQDLPVRYHEWHETKGRRGVEVWVDRAVNAHRMRSRSKAVAEEFEHIEGPQGSYDLFNGVATFTHKRGRHLGFGLTSAGEVRARTDLKSLLRSPRFRQTGVERGAETRVGKADRYVLKRIPAPSERRFLPDAQAYFDAPLIAYVQPSTGRILGYDVEYKDGKGQTTIEYPDRFPDDTFVIPPRNGVKAYDLDAIDARLRARLARPIATLRVGDQTTRLRLVAQGAHRELYVLWSGTKPNGDLEERASVLDEDNGTAFGLAIFTRKGDKRTTALGGHAIQLHRRVSRVDLRVPVFAPGGTRSRLVGYTTVRGVDVEQISEIGAAFPALGLAHY